MHSQSTKKESIALCTHCGEECTSLGTFYIQDIPFCCNGCKLVYQVLKTNGMDSYYKLNSTPGLTQKRVSSDSYDYLKDETVIEQLLAFRDGGLARIKLKLPQIHCTSCLWLLENLPLFNNGVFSSTVNFSKKEAHIVFNEQELSLKALVELLVSIGYKPELNFNSLSKKTVKRSDKRLLFQLGIAGFCFGNIMLLSFPEYLGLNRDVAFVFINYLNILLSIPVLLYSSQDYLISAFNALKTKTVNIDVPIVIGMLALFLRSVFDISMGTGTGFLDSFTGFVFFLLVGKWFQSFTYKSLDYNRDYSSFFPISVLKNQWDSTVSIPLNKVKVGDQIIVKNEQIVPADCELVSGKAKIDYSFVTGEADLIYKKIGDELFAGGKQLGAAIEVKVKKSIDNSYLTQLWNDEVFKQKENTGYSTFLQSISSYFVYIILAIALFTLIYWLIVDSTVALNAFTAVLIIACPCVLALTIPFTYGNIIRLLSKYGLYLQNTNVIENIQNVDTIVFDKTGTITDSKLIIPIYNGKKLTHHEKVLIKSACRHSDHPLSQALFKFFAETPVIELDNYIDFVGQGHTSVIGEHTIRIGSASFIFGSDKLENGSVFIELNGKFYGEFTFKHSLRIGMQETIQELKKTYEIYILSGDNDRDKERMIELIGKGNHVVFNQSPMEKLEFIKAMQGEGNKVMMIGDGLNDSGALKQSDVGVVVSNDNLNFTPASNAVLNAHELTSIHKILSKIRFSKYIIYTALALSILYNGIGLFYSTSGNLSPVIAAILMPISSVSIIIFGVITSYWLVNSNK